jgi:hypothetical protein
MYQQLELAHTCVTSIIGDGHAPNARYSRNAVSNEIANGAVRIANLADVKTRYGSSTVAEIGMNTLCNLQLLSPEWFIFLDRARAIQATSSTVARLAQLVTSSLFDIGFLAEFLPTG